MLLIVFIFLQILAFNPLAYGTLSVPNLPAEGVLSEDTDLFMDPAIDYRLFMGRVTDKSDDNRTLRVKVEHNNVRFLKRGDQLEFYVNTNDASDRCKALVETADNYYIVMKVRDFAGCWGRGRYFRRGTQLNFIADIMYERVLSASKSREMLILKKQDFLGQLNRINHFLWSYDQLRVQKSADFDQQIAQIQQSKREALDDLLAKKKDFLKLQKKLQDSLDELDLSLKFYQVRRQEHLTDRWNLDHDQALPMGQRPAPLKARQ